MSWIDISAISLSRFGLLSNEKLGDLISKHVGDKQIEDADIPLAMVATDVSNGDRVVLDKGPVAKAVMASTSIPGIFKPVEIDGKLLSDGGIVENVPIRTVKELGADYTIGVDLNSKHTYNRPANILEVIVNSFHFLMKQSVELQTAAADLLIEPDLSDFSRSDTSQVSKLIEKGYEDSKDQLNKVFTENAENLEKSRPKNKKNNDMNREEFKAKANQTIDETSAKINELKAKKASNEGRLREKYEESIKDLQERKNRLEAKYEELRKASDEKWEESKEAFNAAANSFKEGFSHITSLFNKEGK